MQVHDRKRRGRIIVIFGLFFLIAAGGIGLRLHSAWALRQETQESAMPIVSVIKASKGSDTEEVVLPGNVDAWHDAPIYARTNGYLKEWKTDIGTQVKAGDVLAEIETPEIDAQLRQAEADLQTAQANSQLAQTTAERWKTLLKTDSVSKQETDEKVGDAAAKLAALASARANRDHLRELESFKHVVAPFDGTITARNTDNGALINAGSGTGVGPELFHIADLSHLRIYVQVPQTYAGNITPDVTAELHFAEHPGKVYTATLLKTADAIDQTSRTLLVEFETDNTNGELLSGGYTEAHLKIPSANSSMRLPVNTLIFRSAGMQVATVGADGRVALKSITIGRDFGNEVEVVAGITPDESVIINPPDSLADGEQVHVAAEQKKDEKKP